MKYSDIDNRKKAFIFELDDVIYPEKDYLFQVYYLFANVLEYTDLIDAKVATDLMVDAYNTGKSEGAFDLVKERFPVDEKYRANLTHLLITAKLPLKLLIYQGVLTLLQDIVVDRKQIFIVTNGKPEQQLNKIKQIEWNGLEPYLTCYFANEVKPKPEPDVIDLLISTHNLQRRDLMMIGGSDTDSLCAENCGIDYINVNEFNKINP